MHMSILYKCPFNFIRIEMALGFVDLEKAYDTVLREMVMATLIWMGLLEAEVMLVEGMYKGMREEFWLVQGCLRSSV